MVSESLSDHPIVTQRPSLAGEDGTGGAGPSCVASGFGFAALE